MATASEQAVPSPEQLLAQLAKEVTSREAKRRMVIEAEVVPFRGEQIGKLNAVLRRFIEENRDSDDPEDLIAVASAIRKYVATMNPKDLGSLALVLDARHNATVPLEVELEVAKTLVRSLTINPPDESDPESELGDRLMEMASTYLTARLLSREKYGAVALNAVLALSLLRSGHMTNLLQRLKDVRVPWFTELVARRAGRIRTDIPQRFPETEAHRYIECVNAVCDELVTSEV